MMMVNTKNYREIETKYLVSPMFLRRIYNWVKENKAIETYLPLTQDSYYTVGKDRLLRIRINKLLDTIEVNYKDQTNGVIDRKEINVDMTSNKLEDVVELVSSLGEFEFSIDKEVYIWELDTVMLSYYRIGRKWYFEIESKNELESEVEAIENELIELGILKSPRLNKSLYDLYRPKKKMS